MQTIAPALLLLLCVTGGAAAQAQTVEERNDFKTHFDAAGVEGTVVIYDLHRDHYDVYNPQRAHTAFIPASTYKIFNALVALETGVVKNEEEIIKWDGEKRSWDRWNQDHTLRSAIKYSVVWFFQDVARRIGEERMRHYIEAAGYGNQNIDGGIDRFWLQGELRITPMEQIDFLVRLYRNDLPFSQRTMDLVKDILIYEQGDAYILRAKTGWAQRSEGDVGWWVGYLEREGHVYFFANNIDIKQDEDAGARLTIVHGVLQDLGLLRE